MHGEKVSSEEMTKPLIIDRKQDDRDGTRNPDQAILKAMRQGSTLMCGQAD